MTLLAKRRDPGPKHPTRLRGRRWLGVLLRGQVRREVRSHCEQIPTRESAVRGLDALVELVRRESAGGPVLSQTARNVVAVAVTDTEVQVIHHRVLKRR